MAKVIILNSLAKEIETKFKGESWKIISLLESVAENPTKGKPLGNIGSIAIKELRYKSFRFYFIADGHTLKVLDKTRLEELLIRFVRMSDKKDQQKAINEIKSILIKIGPEGFD